jgi:hypothetical protein
MYHLIILKKGVKFTLLMKVFYDSIKEIFYSNEIIF